LLQIYAEIRGGGFVAGTDKTQDVVGQCLLVKTAQFAEPEAVPLHNVALRNRGTDGTLKTRGPHGEEGRV
jgi:hypothetical protein